MSSYLALAALALFGSLSVVKAQVSIGSSTGSSYTTSSWTNGASSAFGQWFIQPQGNSINNISNSNQGGRTSIGSSAFFILGGTNNSFIDVFAPLGGSLSSGQSISLSANYSFNAGSRGIEFEQVFGAGALFRFEHGGGDGLRFGVGTTTTEIFANAYNQAFTYQVSYATANSVNVTASLFSNPTPFFTTNVVVAAMPNQVKFYTGGYAGGAGQENFGLYFNNLTTIPEPSTPLLMGLGLAGLLALRKNRKT